MLLSQLHHLLTGRNLTVCSLTAGLITYDGSIVGPCKGKKSRI